MAKKKTQVLNGIEYVFKDWSVWDKEKQYSTHKREYIGKIVDGEFVPNKRYELEMALAEEKKRGPKSSKVSSRKFYGATYLFDQMGEQLGITADLQSCFPKQWNKILSLAYFLILEDRNPLSRFPKWARTHEHPYEKELSSQRLSELCGSIDESAKMEFFKKQVARRAESEYLAYDTTSISSYSQSLTQVKYGYNKDHDPLPQINLAMVFGEDSRLPVYYRKLPGNMSDVKTVTKLIHELEYFNIPKVKLVMDRGFYSRDNITALMDKHYSFLIGLKTSLKMVQDKRKEVGRDILNRSHYLSDEQVYVVSSQEIWKFEKTMPRSKEVIQEDRRVYLQLYYNDIRGAEERMSFHRMLDGLQNELSAGNKVKEHESQYDKYFAITQTPVRGVKIEPKEEAIADKLDRCGYFALLSNHVCDPKEALYIYRAKDLIEKAFGNLKERLNGRTTTVFSEENLDGKLFIQFVALMVMSQVQKVMTENGLFKKYTMQGLLDELDIIELFRQSGKRAYPGEITQKQIDIYRYFEVSAPKD